MGKNPTKTLYEVAPDSSSSQLVPETHPLFQPHILMSLGLCSSCPRCLEHPVPHFSAWLFAANHSGLGPSIASMGRLLGPGLLPRSLGARTAALLTPRQRFPSPRLPSSHGQ